MSDPNLSVTPENIQDFGESVRELAESMRTALDSAAKDVEAVVNGSWTGVLASEFAEGWSDVRDGGSRVVTALAGLAEKLGVTAEAFEARDSSNASALSSSSLDLP